MKRKGLKIGEKMKKLTLADLDRLAMGAAILGSGGGSDPTYDLLAAKHEVEKYGPVSLITLEELSATDLVVPLAVMGAPLITMEKVLTGREFLPLFDLIPTIYGKKPTVLMAAEGAGGNALLPIGVAARLGLPLLDADLIGRAFPELQMASPTLYNIKPKAAFLGDSMGNCTVVYPTTSKAMEAICRQVTIAMGSSSAVAVYIMTGCEAQKYTVKGTISWALSLGTVWTEAKERGIDPIAAVTAAGKGVRLSSGQIVDVDQIVADGFLKGSVHIASGKDPLILEYQNEYLIARRGEKILATTPDILMLFERDSGQPIVSESLAFGLHVELVAFPSPPIWLSQEGLALVGPRYFGYAVDYLGGNHNE